MRLVHKLQHRRDLLLEPKEWPAVKTHLPELAEPLAQLHHRASMVLIDTDSENLKKEYVQKFEVVSINGNEMLSNLTTFR